MTAKKASSAAIIPPPRAKHAWDVAEGNLGRLARSAGIGTLA